MFKLIFALILIMIGFARREAFPCFNLDCSAANAMENCTKPLNCSYGTTARSFCSCCPVCAKGPGENCGNFIGACGKDLQCCLSDSYMHFLIMAVPVTLGTCFSNVTTCPPSTTTSTTTTTTQSE